LGGILLLKKGLDESKAVTGKDSLEDDSETLSLGLVEDETL
jgi:hypothetical protein